MTLDHPDTPGDDKGVPGDDKGAQGDDKPYLSQLYMPGNDTAVVL